MASVKGILSIPYKSIKHDPNAEEIPVVINDCFGGFSLSKLATQLLELDILNIKGRSVDRTDLALVKVVEQLGELADGEYAKLIIEKIPRKYYDYDAWSIDEYDGEERLDLDKERVDLCEKLANYEAKIAEYEQIINFYEKSLELHPDGKKIMELKEHFMSMANKTNK